ncbi:MAG: hypothetical protein PHE29_08855 [Tissierellia bacterium]|nr:hypothetical protein [Tissierellia bacterium]MDD4779151.1 hypothetical protein [Tissierellia bacterium]
MSRLEDIYSEFGLREMINDNKKDIVKLKSDYIAVEQGLLWNPLCKEGNMKEIQKMISEKESLIIELEEALKVKTRIIGGK